MFTFTRPRQVAIYAYTFFTKPGNSKIAYLEFNLTSKSFSTGVRLRTSKNKHTTHIKNKYAKRIQI